MMHGDHIFFRLDVKKSKIFCQCQTGLPFKGSTYFSESQGDLFSLPDASFSFPIRIWSPFICVISKFMATVFFYVLLEFELPCMYNFLFDYLQILLSVLNELTNFCSTRNCQKTQGLLLINIESEI